MTATHIWLILHYIFCEGHTHYLFGCRLTSILWFIHFNPFIRTPQTTAKKHTHNLTLPSQDAALSSVSKLLDGLWLRHYACLDRGKQDFPSNEEKRNPRQRCSPWPSPCYLSFQMYLCTWYKPSGKLLCYLQHSQLLIAKGRTFPPERQSAHTNLKDRVGMQVF